MKFMEKLTRLSITERLTTAAQSKPYDLFELLYTSANGLTAIEIEERIKNFGPNTVAHEKVLPWYQQFFKAFLNPFVGILIGIGAISYLTDVVFAATPDDQPWEEIIVLSFMILISAFLRFIEEYKSIVAAQKLKQMVHNTAAVKRDGKNTEINIEELTVGDIICLAAGDMIPADIRILSSKDLFVSESALTGESIPVEKSEDPNLNKNVKPTSNIFGFSNLCFMGTNVVSGTAMAVVVVSGKDTYFGSMAKEITKQRPLTNFDKGINKVSWILIRFMLLMIPIVLLINGITKHDWLNAILFALSIAVGLTPEMLPMIVSANLAKGSIEMSKQKTIVKRLDSIQNFGAMNILCTDKTGTLTQDKIILEQPLDIYGTKNLKVMEYAYLNSYYQTGLKNLLDNAIIDYGDENKMIELNTKYTKIDELPFDFVRRRMSVILQNQSNERTLFCKGAISEIIEHCSYYYEGNLVKPLCENMRKKVKEVTDQLSQDGLRVLAIAYKDLPANEAKTYKVQDEADMVLAGYVAFLNPPKETAGDTIKALKNLGIDVKIITGDNELVTKKICKEVGLEVKKILLGPCIEKLSDDQLAIEAESTTIFAGVLPLQKSRIIRAFQSRGHIVGYLGDGINDAGALRDADVGISVDTAVDIAKESADIILLEKSLMVLEKGVIEGRKTFGNIIKYIKMTVSSNFGNAFSVLIASIFLPFLPMLPIHFLIQNLLYDFSQTTIPWDNVDEDYLKEPRKWDAGSITKFAFYMGPTSSIFDVITFIVLWNVFGANSVAHQSLFQTGWFVVGLVTQVLIVHIIRTHKIPFIQSIASAPILLTSLTIVVLGIYLPFSFVGAKIYLVPLPSAYFLWLAGIIAGYFTLSYIVKRIYINKYGQWL